MTTRRSAAAHNLRSEYRTVNARVDLCIVTAVFALNAACEGTTAATDAAPGAVTDAADDTTIDARTEDISADLPTGDRLRPADAPVGDDATVDGGQCSLPLQPELRPNVRVVQATLNGASANSATSCRAATEGPEHLYPLHVTEPTVLAADVIPGGMTLALRRACNDAAAGSELACGVGATPVAAAAVRALVAPGAYYLLVEGAMGTSYILTARSAPAIANGSCAAAIPLAPETTVVGANPEGALADNSCGDRRRLAAAWYSVVIPAGQVATLTVASPRFQSTGGVFVHGTASCGGPCQETLAEVRPGAMARQVRVENAGAATRTHYFALEGLPTIPGERAAEYSLHVALAARM